MFVKVLLVFTLNPKVIAFMAGKLFPLTKLHVDNNLTISIENYRFMR